VQKLNGFVRIATGCDLAVNVRSAYNGHFRQLCWLWKR